MQLYIEIISVADCFVIQEVFHPILFQVPKKPLDKKTVFLKQGGQFLLRTITIEGEVCHNIALFF